MGEPFCVHILGSNSALPYHNRYPSSQYVRYGKYTFLIDCGEGCQFRLQEYKLSAFSLDAIFISHLHGDHIFGLPGVLSTLSLNRRRKELQIYAPSGLAEVIQQFIHLSGSKLSFPLVFHEVDCADHKVIFKLPHLEVWTIPLNHRIPTTGFLFKERRLEYNIDKEKLSGSDIPVYVLPDLKKGQDVTLKDGRVFKYKDYTLPKKRPRSYAYLSDTLYQPMETDKVKNVNLLYHEATFMHDTLKRAEETGHSTARQAALFALKANAKKLLLGHFSSRYDDLTPLLEEARSIFPNAHLAVDGTQWEILDEEK